MPDPNEVDVSVSGPGDASRASGPKNEQFAGLNRMRRERTWVDVYLVGGTCLHGQIRSCDASMLLLQTRTGDIALYHHAISTISRGLKRGSPAGKPRRKPGFEPRGGHDSRGPARSPMPRMSLTDRGFPPDDDSGDPDVELPPPTRRPPVVIVKQKKSRTIVKPGD